MIQHHPVTQSTKSSAQNLHQHTYTALIRGHDSAPPCNTSTKIISTQPTPAHKYSSDQRPWFSTTTKHQACNAKHKNHQHKVYTAHKYSSDQRPWFRNGSPIAQKYFAPELFMHIVDTCTSICKHNSNNIIIIEKKCNTKRKIQLLSILYCKSDTCILMYLVYKLTDSIYMYM